MTAKDKKFLGPTLLVLLSIAPCAARCETLTELVDSAAAPRVYFGNPALRDSLVSRIALVAVDKPDILLDLLDTPWATRYDIARRALLEDPERSRTALIARLERIEDARKSSLLLNLFRELGKPGDEPVLDKASGSGNYSLMISACRCLARFGSPERSWGQLAPLLESPSLHVRLAAARAVGEVFKRGPGATPPAEIRRGLVSLLRDPSPQVRFTARESLELIDPGGSGIPASLYPPE